MTAERRGDTACVSVIDNGTGIPASMRPRLFQMFTQLDHSQERAQGGLGIGLSMVKRLVELHDGTVEISSEGIGRAPCHGLAAVACGQDARAPAVRTWLPPARWRDAARAGSWCVTTYDAADSLATC